MLERRVSPDAPAASRPNILKRDGLAPSQGLFEGLARSELGNHLRWHLHRPSGLRVDSGRALLLPGLKGAKACKRHLVLAGAAAYDQVNRRIQSRPGLFLAKTRLLGQLLNEICLVHPSSLLPLFEISANYRALAQGCQVQKA